MVQEKNAAAKRVKAREDFLKSIGDELEENTIKFSWHVIEHTPEYNTGGYYDRDVPAENIKVSPSFETEDEAKDWMDKHEPDEGKTLFVRRMRLIRRVYEEWVSY